MQIRIGLENNTKGRSLAWALDYPGCFAYGEDGPTALIEAARGFIGYKNWVRGHTANSWLEDARDVDVRLIETWEDYDIDDDYETVPSSVNTIQAWFRHDWKPLTRLEVKRGLQLLDFSRADLLDVAQNLSTEALDRVYPGERWSIRGILEQAGGTEWGYLNNLGLAGMARRELPEDAFERLDVVRRRTLAVLTELEGDMRVVGVRGEFWSPRKFLRRALWREREDTEKMVKVLQ